MNVWQRIAAWFTKPQRPYEPQQPEPAAPAEPVIAATEPIRVLTMAEYLMGRDNDPRYFEECTPLVRANAAMLLQKVNRALAYYGNTPRINSGWRPTAINANVGGAPGSHHVYGNAVDLADRDGALKKWCARNLDVLERCGLYMEAPEATPTWVHWQSVPPPSGNRVFIP